MSADLTTAEPVSTNGKTPHPASAPDAIAALRRRPRNIHLAGGFGPALVGIALFLLMLWLAPSVAPERIVERPVSTTTTTVVVTTTAPSTTLLTTTTVAP